MQIQKPTGESQETHKGEDAVGHAYYDGKEQWKSLPGNRYSPDELRDMERYWDVRVVNPHRPFHRSAD